MKNSNPTSAAFSKAMKTIQDFKTIESVKQAFNVANSFATLKAKELKKARIEALPLILEHYRLNKKELKVTQKEFVADVLCLEAAMVTRLIKIALVHVQFPEEDVINTPVNDIDKKYIAKKGPDGKTVKDGGKTLYEPRPDEDKKEFSQMSISEQIQHKNEELLKIQERIKKLKDEEREISKMIAELKKLEAK